MSLSRWASLLGFLTLIGLVTGTIVSLFGRMFVWVGAVVLGAAILVLIRAQYERSNAVRRFRSAHPGKDLLITYSNSPHWQSYIEENWLPRWGERAVFFNRSLPWDRDEPRAKLWITYSRGGEHTPSAVVLAVDPSPQFLGFFSAFRDHKHGKPATLRHAEARLAYALGERGAPDV
jgi:hypothetical protein